MCVSVCVFEYERLTLGHAVQHHVNEDVRASPASAITVRVTGIKRIVFFLILLYKHKLILVILCDSTKSHVS